MTVTNFFQGMTDFLTDAGRRELIIILGVAGLLILLYLVFTWLVYKWQSDAVWKGAILGIAFILFVLAFIFWWWISANNYDPVLKLFGVTE